MAEKIENVRKRSRLKPIAIDSRDVNGDGSVTPVDALIVINELNSQGVSIVAEGEEGAPFMDVNADMSITPIGPVQFPHGIGVDSSM